MFVDCRGGMIMCLRRVVAVCSSSGGDVAIFVRRVVVWSMRTRAEGGRGLARLTTTILPLVSNRRPTDLCICTLRTTAFPHIGEPDITNSQTCLPSVISHN